MPSMSLLMLERLLKPLSFIARGHPFAARSHPCAASLSPTIAPDGAEHELFAQNQRDIQRTRSQRNHRREGDRERPRSSRSVRRSVTKKLANGPRWPDGTLMTDRDLENCLALERERFAAGGRARARTARRDDRGRFVPANNLQGE